jgi:hypothetical protein
LSTFIAADVASLSFSCHAALTLATATRVFAAESATLACDVETVVAALVAAAPWPVNAVAVCLTLSRNF